MRMTIWKRCGAWLLCGAMALSLCGTALAAEGAAQPSKDTPKGPFYPETAVISAWARAEVSAAYANDLIPAEMGWGENYRSGITRTQFARLAVELAAVYNGTTAEALLEQYGIAVPEGETPVPDDGTPSTPPAEETTPPESGETGPDENELPPIGMLSETETEGPMIIAPAPGPLFQDTEDPYVLLAAKMGLVKGRGNGTFGPSDGLTRAEAAVMLQRCLNILGCPDANRAPGTFADGYTIPKWAREAVKYISGRTTPGGQAVMGGVGDSFRPRESYSIEQAIVTILRGYESAGVENVYPGWKSAPGYDTFRITLSFGGDCTFGRGRTAGYAGSFDEMYDKKGAAYFFSNLKAFHTDDLSMVNFEGALTSHNVPRVDKPFLFKGRAEYGRILDAGSIDVVTVANNHARDYGTVGLNDTIRNLSPYVAVSGYDRLPIVEVRGVKVGFASNVGWSWGTAQKQFITDSIRKLRTRGAQIIVFNYHWGEEYQYHSNATQQAIGRYCIDQGADLVIGHHPHVVQEVEYYKGRPIVYSLGNLSFGGNRNPSDKRCMIFQETFTINADTGRVVDRSGKALPYLLSSVKNRNDYRPTPA